MDFYQVLGVPRDADPVEIRSAYRRCVISFHPDLSGSPDSSEFRRIQEAYETLSDPEARAAYDRSLGVQVPVRIVRDPEPDWGFGPRYGEAAARSMAYRQRNLFDELDELFEQVDRILWRFRL